jgi:hypothetical protein
VKFSSSRRGINTTGFNQSRISRSQQQARLYV